MTGEALRLLEGWAATEADPGGSEGALGARSQSCNEGGSLWKQRRWNGVRGQGQGPPAAWPACIGRGWGGACKRLWSPRHPLFPLHPAAPRAAPGTAPWTSGHLVALQKPGSSATRMILVTSCAFESSFTYFCILHKCIYFNKMSESFLTFYFHKFKGDFFNSFCLTKKEINSVNFFDQILVHVHVFLKNSPFLKRLYFKPDVFRLLSGTGD